LLLATTRETTREPVKDSSIVLFSTESCTLCEAAVELLFSMPELRGRSLNVVDIADDDSLVSRYGERLPVLRIGEHELDWPFASEDISGILRQIEQL
jgi:hypothetical protein